MKKLAKKVTIPYASKVRDGISETLQGYLLFSSLQNFNLLVLNTNTGGESPLL